MFAELQKGKGGVFFMVSEFDADVVVSTLAISHETAITSTDGDLNAWGPLVRVFSDKVDVQRACPATKGVDLPVRSEWSFAMDLVDLCAGGHARRP